MLLSEYKDVEVALSNVFEKIRDKIYTKLQTLARRKAVKFHCRLQVDMKKFDIPRKRYIHSQPWFNSETYSVLNRTKRTAGVAVKKAISDINRHYDSFVNMGSGWILKNIVKLDTSVSVFSFFLGGCLSAVLPKPLQRCCFTVQQENNNKCFLYAVAAALMKKNKNGQRRLKIYDEIISTFPLEQLEFPTGVKHIQKFEKATDVSVNIYGYEKRTVFPYYITQYPTKYFHVDLLLHENHYFAIRNLSALISKHIKKNRRKTYVCSYCLSYFVKKSKYDQHSFLCQKKGQQYILPVDKNFAFTNFANLLWAPFVVYCDLETLIEKEVTVEGGKTISKRKHVPIAVAAKLVCKEKKEYSLPLFLYTGKDCIDVFLGYLFFIRSYVENLINFYYVPMHFTEQDKIKFQEQKSCEICQRLFDRKINIKVRDHSHLSGEYRMALCSSCNWTYAKMKKEIFVFFHGLGNYDSHFIIQKLYSIDDNEIKVIPRSSEKYLSFSLYNLVFKDSFQFLPESLDSLVTLLKSKGEHYFHSVREHFKNESIRQLVYRKGVFPYSYVNCMSVLEEKCLPSKEDFFNDLTQRHIEEGQYEFAKKVWTAFKCKKFQDYLEIYLAADCLLLADVFENFREQSMASFHLDPVYYFSSPHFSLDAFLRSSSMTLELLQDVNQYLFIVSGIRGGLCMVSQRYAKANNKYMSTFNPEEPSSFIMYFDANNLYGRAMQDYLPLDNFAWMSDSELSDWEHILSWDVDSDTSCILQVTLHYPSHLFCGHQDYPLAPERHKITYSMLSPVAKQICDKHCLKKNIGAEKLLTTFWDKQMYVLHLKNLQLYVKLGLVIVKIHAGIKFRQAKFMKHYIDFNAKMRAESTNDFDSNFYKLLSNSLFGKTIERPDKRTQIKIVNTINSYEKYVSKLNFKNAKLINKNLVGLELKHVRQKLNKPFIIGMTILELSKYFMYGFHYSVMKNIFQDIQLLYTDTDSLIYHIKTDDVYKDLAPFAKDYFDFSNYSKEHKLYSVSNKKVPGFFKDELAGSIITEFVGLRSKMYSFKVEDNSEIKTAKGVKKSVIQKDLNFEMYKKCLFENTQEEHDFYTISSHSHTVETLHQNKISLSSYEDKRYLLDYVFSLPYGMENSAERVESENNLTTDNNGK